MLFASFLQFGFFLQIYEKLKRIYSGQTPLNPLLGRKFRTWSFQNTNFFFEVGQFHHQFVCFRFQNEKNFKFTEMPKVHFGNFFHICKKPKFIYSGSGIDQTPLKPIFGRKFGHCAFEKKCFFLKLVNFTISLTVWSFHNLEKFSKKEKKAKFSKMKN